MQLVEHHAPKRAEQIGRVGRSKNQRQLLRRGQQNVRRIAALTLALACRRVAGAGLDPDRQLHLGDRRLEIACDVDGERLQRRDVERVQPALAPEVAAGGDQFSRRQAREATAVASPPPIREANGGEGSGVGVAQAKEGRPPPLTPPRRELRSRVGGEQTAAAARACRPLERPRRSTPPSSAEIPPASCRHRWARSAAPIVPPAPSPKVPADARAASSRVARTSAQTARAASRHRCVRGRSRLELVCRRWRGRGRLYRHRRPAREPGCPFRCGRTPCRATQREPCARQRRAHVILPMGVTQSLTQQHAVAIMRFAVNANNPPSSSTRTTPE